MRLDPRDGYEIFLSKAHMELTVWTGGAEGEREKRNEEKRRKVSLTAG